MGIFITDHEEKNKQIYKQTKMENTHSWLTFQTIPTGSCNKDISSKCVIYYCSTFLSHPHLHHHCRHHPFCHSISKITAARLTPPFTKATTTEQNHCGSDTKVAHTRLHVCLLFLNIKFCFLVITTYQSELTCTYD